MKIAVVGSRGYANLQDVIAFIASCPDDTEIITGGARGVDETAEAAALNGLHKVQVIRPDYELHKAKPLYAPIARNQKIVSLADQVVIFWDGTSRGTASVIKFAQQQKKPYKVCVNGVWQ